MNQEAERQVETGVGCARHLPFLAAYAVGASGLAAGLVRQSHRFAEAMLVLLVIALVLHVFAGILLRPILVPESRAVVLYNRVTGRFERLAVHPGYAWLRLWETPRGLLSLGPEGAGMSVTSYTHNDTPVTVHWSGLVQFVPSRWQPEGSGIAFLHGFLRLGIAGQAQALLREMTCLALKESDALTLTHWSGQVALRRRTADRLDALMSGSGLVYSDLEIRRVEIPHDLDGLVRGGYAQTERVADAERHSELHRQQAVARAQTEVETQRMQLGIEYERKQQEWQLLDQASAQAFRRRVTLEVVQALRQPQMPLREQALLRLLEAQLAQLEGTDRPARPPRRSAGDRPSPPPPPPHMNGRNGAAPAPPVFRPPDAMLNGVHQQRERV